MLPCAKSCSPDGATPMHAALNRATVLSAVQTNGLALQHLPPHWRADRGVVLAAVRVMG